MVLYTGRRPTFSFSVTQRKQCSDLHSHACTCFTGFAPSVLLSLSPPQRASVVASSLTLPVTPKFETWAYMETLLSRSTSPAKLVFHSWQASWPADDIIFLLGTRNGAKHCPGIISLNPLHNLVIIPPLKRKNLKFRVVEITWQQEKSHVKI